MNSSASGNDRDPVNDWRGNALKFRVNPLKQMACYESLIPNNPARLPLLLVIGSAGFSQRVKDCLSVFVHRCESITNRRGRGD